MVVGNRDLKYSVLRLSGYRAVADKHEADSKTADRLRHNPAGYPAACACLCKALRQLRSHLLRSCMGVSTNLRSAFRLLLQGVLVFGCRLRALIPPRKSKMELCHAVMPAPAERLPHLKILEALLRH